MKNNILKSVLFACFAVFIGLALHADISGHWVGTLNVPGQRAFPLSYNFYAEGDHLTGTAHGPTGELTIADGKIDGNKFSFNVTISNTTVAHSGQFYGDSLGVDLEADGTKVHATLKKAE